MLQNKMPVMVEWSLLQQGFCAWMCRAQLGYVGENYVSRENVFQEEAGMGNRDGVYLTVFHMENWWQAGTHPSPCVGCSPVRGSTPMKLDTLRSNIREQRCGGCLVCFPVNPTDEPITKLWAVKEQ